MIQFFHDLPSSSCRSGNKVATLSSDEITQILSVVIFCGLSWPRPLNGAAQKVNFEKILVSRFRYQPMSSKLGDELRTFLVTCGSFGLPTSLYNPFILFRWGNFCNALLFGNCYPLLQSAHKCSMRTRLTHLKQVECDRILFLCSCSIGQVFLNAL